MYDSPVFLGHTPIPRFIFVVVSGFQRSFWLSGRLGMLQHATVSKNDDYSQQTGLGAHLTGVADVSLWDLRGLLYLVQLCSILSYKVGPSLHPIMVNELRINSFVSTGKDAYHVRQPAGRRSCPALQHNVFRRSSSSSLERRAGSPTMFPERMLR